MTRLETAHRALEGTVEVVSGCLAGVEIALAHEPCAQAFDRRAGRPALEVAGVVQHRPVPLDRKHAVAREGIAQPQVLVVRWGEVAQCLRHPVVVHAADQCTSEVGAATVPAPRGIELANRSPPFREVAPHTKEREAHAQVEAGDLGGGEGGVVAGKVGIARGAGGVRVETLDALDPRNRVGGGIQPFRVDAGDDVREPACRRSRHRFRPPHRVRASPLIELAHHRPRGIGTGGRGNRRSEHGGEAGVRLENRLDLDADLPFRLALLRTPQRERNQHRHRQHRDTTEQQQAREDGAEGGRRRFCGLGRRRGRHPGRRLRCGGRLEWHLELRGRRRLQRFRRLRRQLGRNRRRFRPDRRLHRRRRVRGRDRVRRIGCDVRVAGFSVHGAPSGCAVVRGCGLEDPPR